jgi:hypothetical protein
MDEEIMLPDTKRNLLVRIKISCEKRRNICLPLSGALAGFVAGNILYFTHKWMSWEMWKLFVTLLLLGLICLAVLVIRWEKRIEKELGI